MLQVTGYATFQREIDEARENHRRNRPVPAAQQAMITAGLARPVPFDFDEGAEVIVQGNFTRRAANGQADSNGLLEYTSHTTTAPAPPAAPRR